MQQLHQQQRQQGVAIRVWSVCRLLCLLLPHRQLQQHRALVMMLRMVCSFSPLWQQRTAAAAAALWLSAARLYLQQLLVRMLSPAHRTSLLHMVLLQLQEQMVRVSAQQMATAQIQLKLLLVMVRILLQMLQARQAAAQQAQSQQHQLRPFLLLPTVVTVALMATLLWRRDCRMVPHTTTTHPALCLMWMMLMLC